MKFIKVLWFDLKNGYFKGVSCYIFPLFIAIIGFFELHRRIAIWGTEVALGDYWMYLYGGMKEYIPTTGNPFQFPTMWIAVFLFSSFAVLNYPMKDLQNMGTQILVHVQGRTKWWISKCLWNVLSTVLYHGIILLVLVILCICFQEPLSFEAHADSIATMFGLWVSEFRGGGVIPIAVILTPVILSIAINLLQMVLLLFTKPVFSFLVICIMMLSSAYFLSLPQSQVVNSQKASDIKEIHLLYRLPSCFVLILFTVLPLIWDKKKQETFSDFPLSKTVKFF